MLQSLGSRPFPIGSQEEYNTICGLESSVSGEQYVAPAQSVTEYPCREQSTICVTIFGLEPIPDRVTTRPVGEKPVTPVIKMSNLITYYTVYAVQYFTLQDTY